jgi:hypothetical protein
MRSATRSDVPGDHCACVCVCVVCVCVVCVCVVCVCVCITRGVQTLLRAAAGMPSHPRSPPATTPGAPHRRAHLAQKSPRCSAGASRSPPPPAPSSCRQTARRAPTAQTARCCGGRRHPADVRVRACARARVGTGACRACGPSMLGQRPRGARCNGRCGHTQHPTASTHRAPRACMHMRPSVARTCTEGSLVVWKYHSMVGNSGSRPACTSAKPCTHTVTHARRHSVRARCA